MEIIAEGLESQKDSVYLLDIGCDKAQGDYFSKPLPAEDFEKALEKPGRDPRPEFKKAQFKSGIEKI